VLSASTITGVDGLKGSNPPPTTTAYLTLAEQRQLIGLVAASSALG
jgi:hypothetical protein